MNTLLAGRFLGGFALLAGIVTSALAVPEPRVVQGAGPADQFSAIAWATPAGSLVGGQRTTTSGDLDVWLARLSDTGDVLGAATLGTSANERLLALAATPGGSLLVLGSTFDFPERRWLTRFDPMAGATLDLDLAPPADPQAVIGGGAMTVTTAGRIVVALPYSNSTSSAAWSIQISVLDASGRPLQTYDLPWAWWSSSPALAAHPDGGFVLAASLHGTEPEQEGAGANVLVVRFDPDGLLLWRRSLDLGGEDLPMALDVAPDGSIVVAGSAAPTVMQGDHDAFITWLDARGLHVETRVFGRSGRDRAGSVHFLRDGGTLVEVNPRAVGAHLLRFDALRRLEWERTIDAWGSRGIRELEDGSLLVAGYGPWPGGADPSAGLWLPLNASGWPGVPCELVMDATLPERPVTPRTMHVDTPLVDGILETSPRGSVVAPSWSPSTGACLAPGTGPVAPLRPPLRGGP